MSMIFMNIGITIILGLPTTPNHNYNKRHTTMWLPLDDPFVIFGLVASGLIIIIAIILLCVVQRRSANDVWKSVKKAGKDTKITEPSESTSDTDSLMTETTVETQSLMVPRAPLPTENNTPKVVRFSSIVEWQSIENTTSNSAPAETFNEIFDKQRLTDDVDVQASPSNRRSMNEQQLSELYFQYV